jgi:hypothetical protein
MLTAYCTAYLCCGAASAIDRRFILAKAGELQLQNYVYLFFALFKPNERNIQE